MLNLAEYQSKPRLLADYLPWACLVAPGVVLNKDGSFQKSYRYRGPDLESSTDAELVAAMARVNNVLRRFGSGWALFFEAVPTPVTDYPDCDLADPASWIVDMERCEMFETAGAAFESAFYLTLLWLPPEDAAGQAERLLIERPDSEEASDWRDRLATFEDRCARAFDLLASCLSEIAELTDDETLSYLHACVSTHRHGVRTPDLPVFLDAVLADDPFTGGLEPMLGDAHLRTLTVLGFPASTTPGILDDLNRQGFSYRWSTRFIALDKHEAEKLLSKKRRHWFAKRKSMGAIVRETLFNEQAALVDNDADNKAADADAALQELGADLVSFGYVTTTVTVMAADRREVDAQLRAAERVINGRGFATIRETLNAVEAWLGSLPGHTYANVRQPIIHSLNLAHMTPLSAVWAGDAVNRHLDAPALIQAQTEGSTPFRLNLHVGDVGHTAIVGPTGAGKSVLLALLALQWRRYQGSQVFIFDKGQSARAAILAMEGAHVDLGGDGRPALQPLKDIDRPSEASFAADWIAGLCEGQGVTVTPALREAIWGAVTALASAPAPQRTLTGLSLMAQDETLKAAIAPFTIEGPHGRLLDADHDNLALSDVACFEMEELMHAGAAVAPVIACLFHRLEARFDGRPTLLILDEAWLFLDDPMFAARIREWLKVLRKKNVSVVFATQSLADIANSSIAPAIIESCLTRIFLPNERALEAQQREVYERFGLNPRQVEIIAGATPKRDYYLQSPRGSRLFDLGLGPVALALCGSSSQQDQYLIDRTVAEAEPFDFAGCFLAAKGIDWPSPIIDAARDRGEFGGWPAPVLPVDPDLVVSAAE